MLTSYNNTTISYDAIGNPLNWVDGSSLTWTDGRKLASRVVGADNKKSRKGVISLMKRLFFSLFIIGLLIIAFCGCSNDLKDENNRQSTEENGAEKTPSWLDDCKNAKDIFIMDDYIYYISPIGIKKYDIRTDKSDMIIQDDHILSLKMYDNTLYYSVDGNSIVSFDLNSGENQVIVESDHFFDLTEKAGIKVSPTLFKLSLFIVNDGKLYIYPYTNTMVQYDPQTENVSLFENDVESSSAAVYNGCYYYTDHGSKSFSIWKKPFDQGSSELIRGDGISKRNRYDLDPYSIEMYDGAVSSGGNLYFYTRYPANIYLASDDRSNDRLIIDDIGDIIQCSCNKDKLYVYAIIDSEKGNLIEIDGNTGDVLSVFDNLPQITYSFDFSVIDDFFVYTSAEDKTVKYFKLS